MGTVEKLTQRCPLKVGRIIGGRYSVRGLLGSGSMGWVVKAADEALSGELVALKVIFPHLVRDQQCLARLRREVSITRQLTHPSIVHLHDFEENPDGDTFLAMEYVRGSSLEELLTERNGRALPLDETVLILRRVAEALLHAHQLGIVHRDLKPSNILIGQDSSVRVCDFGLAKSFEAELGLTRTGESLGTPLYMSPEQFRAETIDQRADIYAFGILAYTLVVGHPPFSGEDYFQLAELHLHEPLPPLGASSGSSPGSSNGSSNGSTVPGWLEDLIRRCAAKRPAERPLSFTEVLPLLEQENRGPGSLTIAIRAGHTHGRFSRSLRRMTKIFFVTLVTFAIWRAAYTQLSIKQFLLVPFLNLELNLGREITPVRYLLGIEISALHPESAFDVLRDAVALGTPQTIHRQLKYQLVILLYFDTQILRTRKPWTPLSSLKDSEGYTLFQRAIRTGNNEVLSVFHSFPVSPEMLDPEGETALTYMIQKGNSSLLSELLGMRNIAVNAPNKAGESPLHVAVRVNDAERLHALIKEFGANPGIKDRKGLTPIHRAVLLRMNEALNSFDQFGADFDVRDDAGRTPLMYAALNPPSLDESVATLATLLADGHGARATINSRDDHAATALILAVQQRAERSALLLLEKGADPLLRDDTGKSVEDYAKEFDLKAVSTMIATLRKRGAGQSDVEKPHD